MFATKDSEGSVFLSSFAGSVYKFNREGKELWKTYSGAAWGIPPMISLVSLFHELMAIKIWIRAEVAMVLGGDM